MKNKFNTVVILDNIFISFLKVHIYRKQNRFLWAAWPVVVLEPLLYCVLFFRMKVVPRIGDIYTGSRERAVSADWCKRPSDNTVSFIN